MFKRKILKVKKSLSSFAIFFGIIYIGSHGQGWSRPIEAPNYHWPTVGGIVVRGKYAKHVEMPLNISLSEI